ncbi:MAG: single-stranded DNA-binding protein [Bacteroidetes bacterium GWF2_38_335]|nr:MAG: single-stranded DNA-binding protein [Bacteroidetes bacterium GWF2_38_335]OFY78710.1 MAG: single-stranded DNA-binding protein [Bacteroidetes bacterium RIFOXYA12_FULL_38_20]HBS88470.1 single-stranded DNA-binding protein [Bacteroidales bacterium]
MAVNKVILIGNAGKDPEVRHLENNLCVANFTLATSETYKNKNGEKVTNTEWHNIVLWRGLAEVAEKYVKKGSQLYIEGKITYRTYDANDGSKKYITEIVGEEMKLLGKKERDGSEHQAASAPAATQQSKPDTATPSIDEPLELADDLPF